MTRKIQTFDEFVNESIGKYFAGSGYRGKMYTYKEAAKIIDAAYEEAVEDGMQAGHHPDDGHEEISEIFYEIISGNKNFMKFLETMPPEGVREYLQTVEKKERCTAAREMVYWFQG